MSFPIAKVRRLSEFLNSLLEITSFKKTTSFSLLGTSIPTAALLGTGASILTPPEAKFKDISSARFVILLILTPADGWSSYLVTAGPLQISVILVSTPKLFNVSTRRSAFALNSKETSKFPLFFGSSKSPIEGKQYPSKFSFSEK